jgi:type IV pilus assembly protein PilQ
MTQEPGERVISLDFEGADIKTVLRAFSEVGGVNIVATKKVEGTVTVKMQNVPWRRAFLTILEANGLAAVEEDGIIRVMTLNELEEMNKSMALETRVFRIKFAKADKLEPVLATMISSRGRIKVETRTNSLVVTDIPSHLDRIGELIEKLDKPTPQVLIQAKMVEVDYSVTRELGINWQAGNLGDPTTTTQVGAEVTAPATSPAGALTFGKILPDVNINAVISALEDMNKADILSQPSILVADNEEALILSGKKIPIVTRDFAGNQIIQFYDVALKLTVTPHISPDGRIMLELHPEISDIAGEAAGAAGPVISSQEAKTKLTANDGETVVIGGIIRDTKEKVKRGVPILSKIPLLGSLFSYTKDKVAKTELMIFVTPKIVEIEE